MHLAIAVPTYNEAENIRPLINGIKKYTKKANVECTVLIIDDNSPDGTGKIADTLATDNRKNPFTIQVLHRKEKQGIHRAYIDGFSKLLKSDYTHILQMDGDLSHDPKYILDFIHASQSSDFIIGSRYIHGGSTPDWSIYRKLLSKYGNIYARIFLGNRIHDYTGGYNMYSSGLLKKVKPRSINASGYGFQIELKYRALKISKEPMEITIVFKERKLGISKIPRFTIANTLLLILKLAIRNLFDGTA